MIGNQYIINSLLLEHEENPIKEKIGEHNPEDIIYMITKEYWKYWRKELTHSEQPYIREAHFGDYKLMYGKSKMQLRKLLKKIRWYKVKFKDEYQVPGTRGYEIYNNAINNFRTLWKQVDKIKKEVNYNLEAWKQKKIQKYGDKAIL